MKWWDLRIVLNVNTGRFCKISSSKPQAAK